MAAKGSYKFCLNFEDGSTCRQYVHPANCAEEFRLSDFSFGQVKLDFDIPPFKYKMDEDLTITIMKDKNGDLSFCFMEQSGRYLNINLVSGVENKIDAKKC